MLALLELAGLPQRGVRENLSAFVVVRAGAEVIGCGGVEPYGSDGLLRSVAVHASHRRRGVAATVVQHLAQRS